LDAQAYAMLVDVEKQELFQGGALLCSQPRGNAD
jgi:hypothetical protein